VLRRVWRAGVSGAFDRQLKTPGTFFIFLPAQSHEDVIAVRAIEMDFVLRIANGLWG
jgi:hypothetical protein